MGKRTCIIFYTKYEMMHYSFYNGIFWFLETTSRKHIYVLYTILLQDMHDGICVYLYLYVCICFVFTRNFSTSFPMPNVTICMFVLLGTFLKIGGEYIVLLLIEVG